jgi:hypothetical protein
MVEQTPMGRLPARRSVPEGDELQQFPQVWAAAANRNSSLASRLRRLLFDDRSVDILWLITNLRLSRRINSITALERHAFERNQEGGCAFVE